MRTLIRRQLWQVNPFERYNSGERGETRKLVDNLSTIVPIRNLILSMRGMKRGESPPNRRGQPAIRKGLLEAYLLLAICSSSTSWTFVVGMQNLCSLPAVDAQQKAKRQ